MGANDKFDATFHGGARGRRKASLNERLAKALETPPTRGGIIKALVQGTNLPMPDEADQGPLAGDHMPIDPKGIAFMMDYLDEIKCAYQQRWHDDDPGFDLIVDSTEFRLAEEAYYKEGDSNDD